MVIDRLRLARVKIAAETISKDVREFLAADGGKRSQVMEAFAKAEARVVVADNLPGFFVNNGWRRVGNTDHFAYLLQR